MEEKKIGASDYLTTYPSLSTLGAYMYFVGEYGTISNKAFKEEVLISHYKAKRNAGLQGMVTCGCSFYLFYKVMV
ncbi:hypothetical protein [Paenibacillus typhae]|uniref:Uncharacterized protein n=1 Tax=Paenibacillus typhae TaxID=1174501 RepID=A0A1G8X4K7_9BACL|nr:hypothetical protein [Paenibacillus typhae]SDJ85552.1 hypothetical protein SAMN05216192_12585 [Paenibacillus typhae]